MGWLRKLLGLEASRRPVPEPVPPANPPPLHETQPPQIVPVALPAGWSLSENGNETTLTHGRRLTIYPAGRSWKFCIADPDRDDEEDDDRYKPFFSDAFPTKEVTRQEALNKLYGRPRQHQTSREIREADAEKQRPQQVADEEDKLFTIKQSFERLKSGNLSDHKTAQALYKRTDSRLRIAQRLWVEVYGDNKDQRLIERAKVLMDGYQATRDEIQAFLTRT